MAIALHGYGRVAQPRRLLLGGTNRRLAAVLGAALAARLAGFEVVSDLADIPAELRGLHPANPVNRPAAGGVQLELPPSARGTTSAAPDPAWGAGGAPGPGGGRPGRRRCRSGRLRPAVPESAEPMTALRCPAPPAIVAPAR